MASKKRSISNDSDVSSALYKECDEASCPICMDHPHNAVLLICSSYNKGCRPYICDTSYRHSNCLDRFKKLKEEGADILSSPSSIPGSHHDPIDTSTGNINSTSSTDMSEPGGSRSNYNYYVNPNFEEQQGATLWERLDLGRESNMERSEVTNLKCPLCRGSVVGSKVVDEARNYLNLKSRSCSRESCSFSGNYRELRRHARRVHPTDRPADVDPSRQRAWARLEGQREYNDIISAIHSAMPGAIVLGDYVIENGERGDREIGGGEGRRRWLNTFFLFQMIGSMDSRGEMRSGGRSRALARHRRGNGSLSRRRYLWGENLLGLQNHDDEDDVDDDDEEDLDVVGYRGDGGNASPNPRRRRRMARGQPDEDRQ